MFRTGNPVLCILLTHIVPQGNDRSHVTRLVDHFLQCFSWSMAVYVINLTMYSRCTEVCTCALHALCFLLTMTRRTSFKSAVLQRAFGPYQHFIGRRARGIFLSHHHTSCIVPARNPVAWARTVAQAPSLHIVSRYFTVCLLFKCDVAEVLRELKY